MIGQLMHLPRKVRKALLFVSDAVLMPFALWVAFVLRLGDMSPPLMTNWAWSFLLVPVVVLPIFWKLGLYRTVVRYMGYEAVWRVFVAVSLTTVVWGVLVFLFADQSFPKSVIAIFFMAQLAMAGGSRMWMRQMIQSRNRDQLILRNVAVYGAGASGAQLVSALRNDSSLQPVAFIDDDSEYSQQHISGLRVYSLDDIEFLMSEKGVEEVLLAIPGVQRQRKREILQALESHALHVRTLPTLDELVEGNIGVQDLREVEISDLLGRDAVPPNPELLQANIEGRCVLVTGAGGSIGSVLCRQIAHVGPSKLVLLDHSEFALYRIEMELRQFGILVVPELGSIQDSAVLNRVFSTHQIDTLFHAAAYKHVPMVEGNIVEGVKNNILGTLNVVEHAKDYRVGLFVLISTDKAVRPTNVMGATKRFTELILQSCVEDPDHSTRFCMVRFGNVLDSSGSVVPLFRRQIREGGPVTVTHRDIIRYFMTIPEAAQLVIQAGSMADGGEVFVLDMGEPVSIFDMARQMVHLSGLEVRDEEHPDGDIAIEIVGLRPGEKLYEELLIGGGDQPTVHEKILKAHEERLSLEEVERFVDQFRSAVAANDDVACKEVLKTAVKGYCSNCKS